MFQLPRFEPHVPVLKRLERLADLGLNLPDAALPHGNYVPAVKDGNHVHLSGTVSDKTGRVGWNVSVKTARGAAISCALQLIAAAQTVVDLGEIERVIELRGFVRAAPWFTKHPLVMDAASDVMASVFGPHARMVVGAQVPKRRIIEVAGLLRVRS